MEMALNMGAFEALDQEESLSINGGISFGTAFLIGMFGPIIGKDLLSEYQSSFKVGYYETYVR